MEILKGKWTLMERRNQTAMQRGEMNSNYGSCAGNNNAKKKQQDHQRSSTCPTLVGRLPTKNHLSQIKGDKPHIIAIGASAIILLVAVILFIFHSHNNPPPLASSLIRTISTSQNINNNMDNVHDDISFMSYLEEIRLRLCWRPTKKYNPNVDKYKVGGESHDDGSIRYAASSYESAEEGTAPW